MPLEHIPRDPRERLALRVGGDVAQQVFEHRFALFGIAGDGHVPEELREGEGSLRLGFAAVR